MFDGKQWGFLFICLTTRGVHFEVASSMDTSSCLMGIQRLVSCRGIAGVTWFDNGTNNIAIEKELLNNVLNWNHQTLTDLLVKKSIEWKFNPRIASPHGCVWERLVRNFKHTFFAVLCNRRLNDQILSTTSFIVEQSLNAHPLAPASADATVLDAFTPNRLMLWTAGSNLPSLANFHHHFLYALAHAYSDAIWSRWLKTYVPSLNSRTKWPSPSNRDLQIGHLVCIVEPTNPRGYYPPARVVKLNLGSDAVARSAEVRNTSAILIYPVVRLAPVLCVSNS